MPISGLVLSHIFLGKDIEAIAAIEKSLELVLPPILLTPLRWFEQDRPDFYQQYAGNLCRHATIWSDKKIACLWLALISNFESTAFI